MYSLVLGHDIKYRLLDDEVQEYQECGACMNHIQGHVCMQELVKGSFFFKVYHNKVKPCPQAPACCEDVLSTSTFMNRFVGAPISR